MDGEVVPPGLVWSVRGWEWHSAQGWRDCAEGTKRLQCQMQASVGAQGPHVIGHQDRSAPEGAGMPDATLPSVPVRAPGSVSPLDAPAPFAEAVAWL